MRHGPICAIERLAAHGLGHKKIAQTLGTPLTNVYMFIKNNIRTQSFVRHVALGDVFGVNCGLLDPPRDWVPTFTMEEHRTRASFFNVLAPSATKHCLNSREAVVITFLMFGKMFFSQYEKQQDTLQTTTFSVGRHSGCLSVCVCISKLCVC